MERKEIILELRQLLEFSGELNEEMLLVDIPEYDSLSVMAIVAWSNAKLKKNLTAQDFANLTTVKSLLDLLMN